jgi:broad specificity phosphatase PhoE
MIVPENTYYIIRHGESEANVAEVIISAPETGTSHFGLTEKGREDLRTSLKTHCPFNSSTLIYSSDFLRAKETAEIVATHAGIEEIHYTPLLRERSFGSLEGKNHSLYEKVWQRDSSNPNNTACGVESPAAVAERLQNLIENIEKAHQGQTILFVSHGDTLQILLTIASGTAPNLHRSIPHLDKGEIRKVIFSGD